jgi:integrase
MTSSDVLDAAGRGRSPATMPGFGRGRSPRNKACGFRLTHQRSKRSSRRCVAQAIRAHGLRTRALIVVLWRAGLRISEALSPTESDLDHARGSILIRRGKGGRRREVGLDAWAWQHLNAWLEVRVVMRVGALLCVIDGPTQGRPWSATAARATLRRLASVPGVRRRFAPHQYADRSFMPTRRTAAFTAAISGW